MCGACGDEQAQTTHALDVLRERVRLERGLHAPRRARELVDRLGRSAGLDEERREVAVLLTSEVVTNAVVHGAGEPEVTVEAGAGGVRVQVTDGSRVPPQLRRVGPDAVGGRGVALLDILADAWGAAPTATGKAVWFELGSPSPR